MISLIRRGRSADSPAQYGFECSLRSHIASDHGEKFEENERLHDSPAESLSGHAENKERAYMVKLYAAKIARGERLFEAPPVEAIR